MPPLKRDHSRSMDYTKICGDEGMKVPRSTFDDSQILENRGISGYNNKAFSNNNHSPFSSRKLSEVDDSGQNSGVKSELSP